MYRKMALLSWEFLPELSTTQSRISVFSTKCHLLVTCFVPVYERVLDSTPHLPWLTRSLPFPVSLLLQREPVAVAQIRAKAVLGAAGGVSAGSDRFRIRIFQDMF